MFILAIDLNIVALSLTGQRKIATINIDKLIKDRMFLKQNIIKAENLEIRKK
jgi:hypothetical protein